MTSPFLPEEADEPQERTPWGFRLTLAATALYLLYRLGQGVVWVFERIF